MGAGGVPHVLRAVEDAERQAVEDVARRDQAARRAQPEAGAPWKIPQ